MFVWAEKFSRRSAIRTQNTAWWSCYLRNRRALCGVIPRSSRRPKEHGENEVARPCFFVRQIRRWCKTRWKSRGMAAGIVDPSQKKTRRLDRDHRSRLQPEVFDLALPWPKVRVVDQGGSHRILADVFPLFAVTFCGS